MVSVERACTHFKFDKSFPFVQKEKKKEKFEFDKLTGHLVDLARTGTKDTIQRKIRKP